MNTLDLVARGRRIARIRKSKYVTESEICEYVGIARTSYRGIESGKRDMRCFEALKIAEYLNVHPNLIIGFGAPKLQEDKVRKLAVDNGFGVTGHYSGRLDISPRLFSFARQVVDHVHAGSNPL